MSKVPIVIADDHHVVREGIRLVLEAEQDLSIVGEAGSGLKALELVENLKPNVMLLDLMMSGLNGLEVTWQARRASPRTRIVILSMYADEAYVSEALRNGAAGYVLKEASSADLITAVRRVSAGFHYLSPPLSEQAIAAYVKRTQAQEKSPHEALSKRERQVLQLIAEGDSNSEIGSKLFISRRTVETHRSNLVRKLGLRTQRELMRYALRRRFVPPTDQATDR